MIVEGTLHTLVAGVVRHAITAAAASYGIHGYLGDDNTALVLGAVGTILNVGWFVAEKKLHDYKSTFAAKRAVDAQAGNNL